MKKLLYILLFVPLTILGQSFLAIEQDSHLELYEGWNMFGFNCFEPMNVSDAFISIEDKVVIVKDNNGAVYLPEFSFNGIGDLVRNRGYQIKTTEVISDFQFCPFLVPLVEGCSDSTAFNFNPNANSDDGSCYPFIYGCIDPSAFNYNDIDGDGVGDYFTGINGIDINTDDGSCFPVILGCLDIEAYNYNDYNGDGVADELTGINGVDVNTDDGSCVPFIYGCTDQTAYNYNPEANTSDLNELYCIPVIIGCNIPSAYNYNDFDGDGEPNEYTGNLSIDVNTYLPGSCIDKVFGCTDATALNYNVEANTDDGTCIPFIYGCISALSFNYDSLANTDDGTCIPFIYGCTDVSALNYNVNANANDGSCIAIVYGCTDETAFNYNINANVENGSCVPFIYGCTDETAYNYNPEANTSDLNELYCIPIIIGCNIPSAYNYNDFDGDGEPNEFTGNPSIDVNTYLPGSCIDKVFGCTDATALNYNVEANTDDGTCIPFIYGCMDSLAFNYNAEANTDDGTCTPFIYGCMDSLAFNYNAEANTNDDSCVEVVSGCMDSLACNFNPEANMADGSCEYAGLGYDCQGNFSEYVVGMEAEGGLVFYVDSTGERGLVADTGNVAGLFEWGCFDIDIPNLYPSYILSGSENTQNIINQNCQTEDGNMSAAEFAISYENQSYVDWFLPSKSEFQTLIENIGLSDELFHPIIDNFSYWTSTQWGNLTSFSYDSELNVFVEKTKHSECAVIPIRAFGYTLGCMDSLACNYNSEANMADGSCTYADLGYDCDGNITEYVVGMEAEGGIVFYVDETGERGLVSASEDIGHFEWGCYQQEVNGADGTSIGTGYQNTLDIVNQGCQTQNGGITAAQAALDAEINGYSDWYLPSKDEITETCSIYITDIASTEWYSWFTWSSSVEGPHSGWGSWYLSSNANEFCESGNEFGYRYELYKVRPIRAFGYTLGCMDSLACNFNPDANMADGSCTYAEEGYDCDGNITEYIVGMEAEGGIVFYVDETGERGLVVALEDINLDYGWGCDGVEINGADGWDIGFGFQNTLDIVNDCSDTLIAASLALSYESGGYTDWYLPSYLELREFEQRYYDNAFEINGSVYYDVVGPCNWGPPCYNEPAGAYFSSTEVNSNTAWFFWFGDDIAAGPKSPVSWGMIRPIRAFGNWTMGCTDETACNYNPEANMADGSCTYAEQGYDCNGNIIAQIGDIMEGGYLFYLDETGQHGLVSAMEDLDGTYEWGCMGVNINGADGISIGTGNQNSMDIVNQGCLAVNGDVTAAQAALNATLNGYDDWYLPSFDELTEIYNLIGLGAGTGNIGNFESLNYWTSTQDWQGYEVDYAMHVHFGGSSSGITRNTKASSYKVRPIRSF